MKTKFESQLTDNIKAFIREAKREGTTGMSLNNLRQCVRTPSPYMEGAPRDQFHYNAIFEQIASEFSPFVY
jgi:hypothetical protein